MNLIRILILILISPKFYSQNYELPINKRFFYRGIVSNPANAPHSSFQDLINAYMEAGNICEVSMVWVEKEGIGEYELLKRNQVITAVRFYRLIPLITLNFAKITIGPQGLEYVIDAPEGITPDLLSPDFRSAWIEEAKNIAKDFKPEYSSLGNEINDYFYLHPDDLGAYLSLLNEAYNKIKEISPSMVVTIILSYNHLIENNQGNLFELFNDYVDMIGITTYPYKVFSNPEDIPEDYYSRIKEFKKNQFLLQKLAGVLWVQIMRPNKRIF